MILVDKLLFRIPLNVYLFMRLFVYFDKLAIQQFSSSAILHGVDRDSSEEENRKRETCRAINE